MKDFLIDAEGKVQKNPNSGQKVKEAKKKMKIEKEKAELRMMLRNKHYNKIINGQKANGSWPMDSKAYLLSHISKNRASKESISLILKEGYNHPDFSELPSQLFSEFVLTIVAIELLKSNFSHKKGQWKMIA